VLADLCLDDSDNYFLDRAKARTDEIFTDCLERLRVLKAFGKLHAPRRSTATV
jgi:hypothetical protein